MYLKVIAPGASLSYWIVMHLWFLMYTHTLETILTLIIQLLVGTNQNKGAKVKYEMDVTPHGIY
jgi:hypothetical protein